MQFTLTLLVVESVVTGTDVVTRVAAIVVDLAVVFDGVDVARVCDTVVAGIVADVRGGSVGASVGGGVGDEVAGGVGCAVGAGVVGVGVGASVAGGGVGDGVGLLHCVSHQITSHHIIPSRIARRE
jgi:hypothetical protein